MLVTIPDEPKVFYIEIPSTFCITVAAYSERAVEAEVERLIRRVKQTACLYQVNGADNYLSMRVMVADPDTLKETITIKSSNTPSHHRIRSSSSTIPSRWRALDKPCPTCHGIDKECMCHKPHALDTPTDIMQDDGRGWLEDPPPEYWEYDGPDEGDGYDEEEDDEG